jgi:hypothetical protein
MCLDWLVFDGNVEKMNTLSWLIYAADALVSIKTIFGTAAIILLISTVIILAAALIVGACGEADDDDDARAFSRHSFRYFRIGLPIVIIASFLYAMIPTANTIYMIAASEAGEQIVTSPGAVEMMGDLKAIIKKKLKEELETE